jgi:hypothetical protein
MPRAVKPFRNERANATGPREPANDTGLERGDLTVEIARAQPLAGKFLTLHLGFDAVPAVIAFGATLEPVAGWPLTIVARSCGRSVSARDVPRCARWLRGCPAATAWRSCGAGVRACPPPVQGQPERGGTAGSDGVMAFAAVEGTVSGDTGDLLVGRDLVQ